MLHFLPDLDQSFTTRHFLQCILIRLDMFRMIISRRFHLKHYLVRPVWFILLVLAEIAIPFDVYISLRDIVV